MTWHSLIQKRAFLYFLILPFFIPYSLKFIPSLTKIYNFTLLWRLASVLFIFILYLLRQHISRSMLLILALNLLLFVFSVINRLSRQSVYMELLTATALPMLIELGISGDIKKTLNILCNILSLLVLINFVFLIIFPTGLPFATLYTQYRNPLHFLGQDNGIVYTLITLLGLNYLLYDKKYPALILKVSSLKCTLVPRNIIFNFISIFTMLCVGSATGLLLVSIFIILAETGCILRNKLYMWIFIGLYLSFFILVILAGNSIPLLSHVTSLLGRDAGFTGRSLLWEKAIEIIKQNLLLGLGNNSDVINIWGKFFSAHNQLLDIAVRGGLITLFLFAYLHIRVFYILSRANIKKLDILFITIFCFLTGGLMEAGVRQTQYMFLILASYVNCNEKLSQVIPGDI